MSTEWGGGRGQLSDRAITTLLVIVAVVTIIAGAFTSHHLDRGIPEDTTTTTTTRRPCFEDEPCWDCTTMGNRICGPTTTEGAA